MIRSLAVAAFAFGLTGCSLFMHTVERPKVDVRGVALENASLTAGLEGKVSLDVTNPNPVGVPLSGIDWQLSIGGAAAVRGHVDVAQTIPPQGVAPVIASITIGATDAFEVVRRVAGGARDYTLDARLHFATSLGEIAVDVHKDGALSDAVSLE